MPNKLTYFNEPERIRRGIPIVPDVRDLESREGSHDHVGMIHNSLFDANTILYATDDNTPLALTVPEQTIVGRITSGNIDALTGAEVLTVLSGQAGAAFDWNGQILYGLTYLLSGANELILNTHNGAGAATTRVSLGTGEDVTKLTLSDTHLVMRDSLNIYFGTGYDFLLQFKDGGDSPSVKGIWHRANVGADAETLEGYCPLGDGANVAGGDSREHVGIQIFNSDVLANGLTNYEALLLWSGISTTAEVYFSLTLQKEGTGSWRPLKFTREDVGTSETEDARWETDGVWHFYQGIDMEDASITDLADPSNAQDAATKTYVDTAIDTDVATHAALTATHGITGHILGSEEYIGSTFPVSPYDGQVFTHETTGRKITYVYDLDNTTWIPIISIGTMTMYVDKTDGTDDVSHGIGVDSDAFATVQYAVDRIPGLIGGNVVIYVNAEDYDESVTIQGKRASGNYTITIEGTLTVNTSGTQSANGVQGTGATKGSFTDTGNLAGIANLLLYLDSDSEYSTIHSTDGNTAEICGCFASQPLQNENYVVYDWGTSINSIVVQGGQQGIILNNLDLDTASGLTLLEGCSVTTNRCKLNKASNTNSILQANECYAHITNRGFDCSRISYTQVFRSKVFMDANNYRGMRALDLAFLIISRGTVIDCNSKTSSMGVEARGNSIVNTNSAAANGYIEIKNCATGIEASLGSRVVNTSNNVYTNNTTDESAVGTGEID